MPRRAKIIPFPGARVNQSPAAPRHGDAPRAARRGGDDTLVEAYRCNGSEALIVRGLLESHGIPALLRSRLAHSVHPFTVGDQGEVVVLVAEAHAVRAKRLLTRRASQA